MISGLSRHTKVWRPVLVHNFLLKRFLYLIDSLQIENIIASISNVLFSAKHIAHKRITLIGLQASTEGMSPLIRHVTCSAFCLGSFQSMRKSGGHKEEGLFGHCPSSLEYPPPRCLPSSVFVSLIAVSRLLKVELFRQTRA